MATLLVEGCDLVVNTAAVDIDDDGGIKQFHR